MEPNAGKSFGSSPTSLAEEAEWFVPKLGVVEFGGSRFEELVDC